MSTETQTRATRWGEVTYTYERMDSTYGRHIFEGPREAVIVEVANGLQRTTQMYEHMFTLNSLVPHRDEQKARCNWIRAECTSSNYAGD